MAAYGMIVYLIYENRYYNELITRHIFYYPNLLARDCDPLKSAVFGSLTNRYR